MKLAAMMDVAPGRLFFKNRLGMAFGAGSGRGSLYRANSEWLIVSGGGQANLAHEWFRAFDRTTGRRMNVLTAGGYLSEAAVRGALALPRRPAPSATDGALGAWRRRVHRIRRTQRFYRNAFGAGAAVLRRARILDGYRPTPHWSAPRRMAARAFESCVGAVSSEEGGEPDPLLAAPLAREPWKAWAALARIEASDGHPYLNDDEEGGYRKAMFAMVRDWLQDPAGEQAAAPDPESELRQAENAEDGPGF